MNVLTPPLKWHGGKHYLAKRIIELFPPHTHYVEPFFGGGAVLLAKDPEGVSEVANDLNRDLTAFWQVLMNPELFEQFRRHVEGMPFSSELFDNAKAHLESGEGSIVDRAAAFFVVARQSRQGLMKDFATLSRNRTRRGMNEQVSSWLTAIEGLPEVHARLKRVVILNKPAVDVIRQQDGPNTLFYCDSPYLHETRVTTSDYAHEMSQRAHAILLVTLGGHGDEPSWATAEWWSNLQGDEPYRDFLLAFDKPMQGKFILSGYPSELYDAFAKYFGWHRVDIQIDNKASSKATKEIKTECLWMNYTPEQPR